MRFRAKILWWIAWCDKNNQDNNFNDKKLTTLDSITIIRNPSSDNEILSEKFVGYGLDKNSILKFNQTLENDLEVLVGYDVYNPTKHDKIQNPDTTIIKHPNTGGHPLQQGCIEFNEKIWNGEIQNFSCNQQKQMAQQVILDQQSYFLILTVLCSLRQALKIMERMCFVVLNWKVFYSILISHSILTDLQF